LPKRLKSNNQHIAITLLSIGMIILVFICGFIVSKYYYQSQSSTKLIEKTANTVVAIPNDTKETKIDKRRKEIRGNYDLPYDVFFINEDILENNQGLIEVKRNDGTSIKMSDKYSEFNSSVLLDFSDNNYLFLESPSYQSSNITIYSLSSQKKLVNFCMFTGNSTSGNEIIRWNNLIFFSECHQNENRTESVASDISYVNLETGEITKILESNDLVEYGNIYLKENTLIYNSISVNNPSMWKTDYPKKIIHESELDLKTL